MTTLMNSSVADFSWNCLLLDPPFGRGETGQTPDHYRELTFELAPRLRVHLEKLAGHEFATAAPAYLAAYAILLSRYGNTQEPSIRLANGAMVRARCVPEFGFRKLMQEVAGELLAVGGSQSEGFSEAGRGLTGQVQIGETACDPACFIWEARGEDSGVSALRSAEFFDIALQIRTGGDVLKPSLLYHKDRFEASTIERMASHFLALLQSIAEHPEKPIGELNMVSEAERALILSYAGTKSEYPQRCVHELFDEVAALYPDAEALVSEKQRVSYGELKARANQVAQFLRAAGIAKEDRIGLFMDRSIEMIVCMLGVLKAGGAYVPIDPEYPEERKTFIATDAAVKLVLTTHGVLGQLSACAPIVYVDGVDSPIGAYGTDPVSNISAPQATAVVIYTSGSTGQPKAACIPHRAIVRTVRNTNYVQVTPEDAITQVCSPSFDGAIMEIWLALANGAKLVIIRPETLLDTTETRRLIQAERLTILIMNTAHLHQIGRDTPDVLKGVRKVIFGGEAAEPEPLQRILQHLEPGVLVNGYGPAECCVTSTFYEITAIPEGAKTVPIGRAVTNAQIYLLDQHKQLVPLGFPGEIYIGGDGVASGYWNRPALNAERFVADEFSDRPDALLYRTGDLARMHSNGDLEFLGRVDDQIKIRGQRIEPGEVRQGILSHPAVKQVFVMVREDQPGDKRMVAYVTLQQPLASPQETLRQHAKGKLPAHMLPAAFVILDSIPLNTNGKVDRKALPAPSGRVELLSYQEPQTQLERVLAAIWQDLLQVEKVGLSDNFFELGGHSLLAARLGARLEKETGYDMPVAALFDAPTIGQLARKLQDGTYKNAWNSLVELYVPQEPTDASPLFCIVWLGINLVTFRDIASQLRGDRPVYALQSQRSDGTQQSIGSVEAIAAAYMKEIRNKQPHGPYHLCGICIGGVLAYEIAQQLKADGEEVASLMLIESFLPGKQAYVQERSSLTEYIDNHLGEMLRLPNIMRRVKYLARWASNGGVWLRHAFGGRLPAQLTDNATQMTKENASAVSSYQARPYAGKLIQFLCSDAPQRTYSDRRLAWSCLAQDGLEVRLIPGDHLTWVEPRHLRVVASQLESYLDRSCDTLVSERRRQGQQVTVRALPVPARTITRSGRNSVICDPVPR